MEELEPVFDSQISNDDLELIGSELVEQVAKLVPQATTSQCKKALITFAPPDPEIAAVALRNFLGLPPADGQPVS